MDSRSTKKDGPEGADVRLAAVSPILADAGRYEEARGRLLRGIVGTERRLFPDLEDHFRVLFLRPAPDPGGSAGTTLAEGPSAAESPRPTRVEEEFLGRALD